MTKTCKKCALTKSITEFYPHKEYKDGLHSCCKECERARSRANAEKHKITIANRRLKEDKALRKARKKAWYEANKDKEKATSRIYRINNRSKVAITTNNWYRAKRKNDPLFKLKQNIRASIFAALKKHNFKKTSKTLEIIGCSFDDLINHLEQSAIKNYGKYFPKRPYEIDHVIPLSTAKSIEDVIKLNHYSNLQYLYPIHNKQKSNHLSWSIKNIRFDYFKIIRQEDMDVQDSKEKPSS